MTTSSIVSRSAHLLDTICASTTPLTFTQIVAASQIPKSSTHRIVSILVGEGLIAFDAERQTYEPGERLMRWASGAFKANDLPGRAEAELEDLSTQTGAHVALSILDGKSVLYLRTIGNGEPYRLAPRVGEHSPVHACAAGKAILAHLSTREQERILSDLNFERFTEKTILKKQDFVAALQDVRKTGIAICDREEFLQIAGVSAPVFGHHGDVIAAVSVWNVVDKQDIKVLLRYKSSLLSATQRISVKFGHQS